MTIEGLSDSQLKIILVLTVWELIWKSIALWRAARNYHQVWFAVFVIFSTAGILPIIYLLTHKSIETKKE